MVTRFVGSRSADGRRRRMSILPGEEESPKTDRKLPQQSETSQDSSRENSASAFASVPATPLGNLEFPVRKLISQKPWKIGLLCFVVMGVAGLLVLAADYFSKTTSQSATALETMFQLPDGLAYRVFAGVLLICCAQLSFVIGWARSQSQKDFHGSYRIWKWNAAWLFCVAVGLLNDFSPVLAEAMAIWGGDFSRYPAELFWLLPISFAGSVLAWNLIGEMRESQFARLCYWGTLSGVLFLLLMRYATGISIPYDSTSIGMLVVSLTSVCLLFVSLLTQCRQVLHRSVDPPQRTDSFLLKFAAIFGGMLLKCLSLIQQKKSDESPEKKTKPKKKQKNVAAGFKEKKIVSPQTDKPATAQPVESKEPASSKTSTKPVSQKQEPIIRIDEPLDPALLKGLSKKERRKLRQEHRQKNRQQSEENA